MDHEEKLDIFKDHVVRLSAQEITSKDLELVASILGVELNDE